MKNDKNLIEVIEDKLTIRSKKSGYAGLGIPFHQVYTEDINRVYAENLSRIVYYWNPEAVEDKVGLFKFLLAHKYIRIDLESDVIDVVMFRKMADEAITDEQYSILMKKINLLKQSTEKN